MKQNVLAINWLQELSRILTCKMPTMNLKLFAENRIALMN